MMKKKDRKFKKAEEPIEARENEEDEGNYMAIGMCLGMCFGLLIGVLLDDTLLYMPIGMCLGLAIGSAIKKKPADGGEKDKDGEREEE